MTENKIRGKETQLKTGEMDICREFSLLEQALEGTKGFTKELPLEKQRLAGIPFSLVCAELLAGAAFNPWLNRQKSLSCNKYPACGLPVWV